jgi:hypothetical protein
VGQREASAGTEREFGLVVGSVLMGLGGWWLYRRGSLVVAPGFLLLGSLLILLGAIRPRTLRLPSRLWMALAERLSILTTRIILALVFFGLVTPLGVLKRRWGWDPLRRRAPRAPSYWSAYPPRQRDPRHYEKMF